MFLAEIFSVWPELSSSPGRLPLTVTSTPWLLRMRWSRPTSASRGTLSSFNVPSGKRLAIIKGGVAFFAPEIGIVPTSGRPPLIRIRSIALTPLSRAESSTPRPGAKQWRSVLIRGRVLALARAAARLRLAALEVLAPRGSKALGAGGLLTLLGTGAVVAHGGSLAPRRAAGKVLVSACGARRAMAISPPSPTLYPPRNAAVAQW